MISFPDIGAAVSSNLSDQIADSGFLSLITLVAGIYLGLWAMQFVVGLFWRLYRGNEEGKNVNFIGAEGGLDVGDDDEG